VRDQFDPGGDPVVIMKSLGTVNGAEREIEVVMEMKPGGSAEYAILTQDDINSISGNPIITGPYADIHSNADVIISGEPQISGAVTAVGEVIVSSNPDIEGGMESGAAAIELPHIYPPEYFDYRTVLFSADCRVLNAAGAELFNASSGKWHGWDCSSGDKWTLSVSDPGDMYHGFYYVEGNVVISGSPTGSWWDASFVTEGYIEVSGNPWIRPWGSQPLNDTGNAIANEILFYAGNDLKINGNSEQQFQGILATHMEIMVSGNPYLEGTIVAENGAGQEITTGQLVKNLVDQNMFNGNMYLNATGSALFGSGKQLTVTAWRELVN
jgi:cytoskeletal protein CcmA (bactofilin family)